MKYSALSVVAPAGEKVATKEKTIEVRSWVPDIVSLLNVAIVQNEHYLLEDGQEDENGFVVAVVDFESVEPWKRQQLDQACSKKWVPGYFAWHVTNVRKLDTPIKATAKRKIYEIDLDLDTTRR